MSNFLMKPKIDFAFKEIMADEKARTGFLAAVLNLDPEDIKETRILNSYLRKIYEEDKLVQRCGNNGEYSARYFRQRKAEEGGDAGCIVD